MRLPATIEHYRAWSGEAPTCEPSADGWVWWCRMEKASDGQGPLFLTVYRQRIADDFVEFRWRSQPMPLGAGKGGISVKGNGQLWVSYYEEAGDGRDAIPVYMPGFVPFPMMGPPGTPGLKGDKGDPGPAGALAPRDRTALDRLCDFLKI